MKQRLPVWLKIGQTGENTCGWDWGSCGKPAAWHFSVSEGGTNCVLLCSDCMEGFAFRYAYNEAHVVNSDCSMPGARWSKNGCYFS